MLFRLFKVNNGALEVLEESTVQEKKVDTQDKVLL